MLVTDTDDALASDIPPAVLSPRRVVLPGIGRLGDPNSPSEGECDGIGEPLGFSSGLRLASEPDAARRFIGG